MLEICWPPCGMGSSLELINYAFPARSSLAKKGGMSLCLCGKPHILVVFCVGFIVMLMCMHVYMQIPSYLTPH